MRNIMYIILLCIFMICSACNNGVEHRNGNKEKSVTITSINETQEDSLYPKWCSLVDSLTCYSEKQLPNNLHVYLSPKYIKHWRLFVALVILFISLKILTR